MNIQDIFTAKEWLMIVTAALHATAGLILVILFFRSRYWKAMVLDASGHPVAGDIMKAGSFLLAVAGVVAVFVAELGFGRVASLSLIAIIPAVFGYSGVMQDIKRRGKKDAASAGTPEINIKDSEVKVGPNNAAPQVAEPLMAGVQTPSTPPIDLEAVRSAFMQPPTAAPLSDPLFVPKPFCNPYVQATHTSAN